MRIRANIQLPVRPAVTSNLLQNSLINNKVVKAGLVALSVGALCFAIKNRSFGLGATGLLGLGFVAKINKSATPQRLSPLQEWFESQPNTGSRDIALKRIRICLNNCSESLYLQGLNITSLPNGLSLSQLKFLNLDNTKITSLPEGLHLPELEELKLRSTPVTALPNDLHLPKLKLLNFINSKIRSLPEGLYLPELERMYFGQTPITTLPRDLNLPKLKLLSLSNTKLSSLPDGLSLPQLKLFDLSYTKLTTLPEDLNFPELQGLDLRSSRITSLPNNLNFPNLTLLDLRETFITSLPESIFNLPRECTVRLTLSNFSEAIQERLRERISQAGYIGPRFEFEMTEQAPSHENAPLEESVQRLLAIAKSPQPSSDLINSLFQDIAADQVEGAQSNLNVWIGKLLHTASAKSQGRVSFMQSIVAVLNQAREDSSARFLFHEIVRGAITTCGDRVALSAMHLDIQTKLHQKESVEEVYKFLVNTVYTMAILEKRAHRIVPRLPFTDPLEVYLGLPIQFKDEFSIDINTSEMLYYRCSGLRDSHLKRARIILKKSLMNVHKVTTFLQSQPKWLEILERTYSDEFSAAKKQRDEDGIDPDKAEKALANYQDSINDLSLRLIEDKGLF